MLQKAKSFARVAAQGEITIIRLGDVPRSKKLEGNPLKPEGNSFVVGHSETGHHHVIACEGADVAVRETPTGMRILHAILKSPNSLSHLRDFDTHTPVALAPGEYEFRIGREFDPFQEVIRQQKD